MFKFTEADSLYNKDYKVFYKTNTLSSIQWYISPFNHL